VLRTNKRIEGRAAVRELDERLLAQRMIQIYHQAVNDQCQDTAPHDSGNSLGKARTDART
jgi:hypothetical protein